MPPFPTIESHCENWAVEYLRGNFTKEATLAVEDLHSCILAVRHKKLSSALVPGQAVGNAKLPWTRSHSAPAPHEVPAGIELDNPRVAVAVGYIDRAVGPDRHICGLAEVGMITSRLQRGPEREHRLFEVAGQELENLVEATVDNPNVATQIDGQAMWHLQCVLPGLQIDACRVL